MILFYSGILFVSRSLYSINTLLGTAPYRVEFTPPISTMTLSRYQSTNKSFIRFTDGSTNIGDFGLILPENMCATTITDPMVVAGCGGSGITLVSFPYYQGRVTSNQGINLHYEDNTATQVGVPFDLTSDNSKNIVYFTTVASPSMGWFSTPPDGNGAIYAASYPSPTYRYASKKLLVNLSSYINISNQFPVKAGTPITFGEFGLGNICISTDYKTLYTINLGNGKLVKIDISNVDYNNLPATAPTAAQISEITIPPSVITNCVGRFRPVALERLGNKLYIGGVCDGNIQASVIEYDITTNNFREVFTYALSSFTTGYAWQQTGNTQVNWSLGGLKPILAYLAFDDTGSLILGFIQKTQMDDPVDKSGYILRTIRNSNGTFTLENAGTSGNFVTSVKEYSRSSLNCIYGNYNVTSNDGPGQKWFFGQTSCVTDHTYMYSGGLSVLPGSNEVLAGFADPLTVGQLGVTYLDWRNGDKTAGRVLANSKFLAITGNAITCAAYEIVEIGNRVWLDTNKNGIQDASELGIANIPVILKDSLGNTLATAVTDSEGNYIFSNDPNGTSTSSLIYGLSSLKRGVSYSLNIENIGSTLVTLTKQGTNTSIDNDAQLVSGNAKISLTTSSLAASDHTYDFGFQSVPNLCYLTTGFSSLTCNDAGTNYLSTDDYVTFSLNPSGGSLGTNYSVSINTGTLTLANGSPVPLSIPYGSPINFRLQNGSADSTLFYTITVSDVSSPSCKSILNFFSKPSCSPSCNVTDIGLTADICNNNGTVSDTTDDYISFNINPQGYNLGTRFSVSTSSGTLTLANGTALPVSFPYGTPVALRLQNGSANGTPYTITIKDRTTTTCINTTVISKARCSYPELLLTIGSTVFADANNNGIQDASEVGIGNVPLSIYFDTNGNGLIDNGEQTTPLKTTTTDANGNYIFTELQPGNYQVQIPVTAFAASAPLEFLTKSSTDIASSNLLINGTANANIVDGDDNGTQSAPGAVVVSPIITLAVGTEPTTETGQGGNQDNTYDANGNMTVDFGFHCTNNCNYVFTPVPITGIVSETSGTGTTLNNAIGAMAASGAAVVTGSTNTSNVASLAASTNIVLSFPNTIPIGSVITISLGGNATTAKATITDGVNTLNYTAAAASILERVSFTTGQATNSITISRTAGNIYVDGASYSFTSNTNDYKNVFGASIAVTGTATFANNGTGDIEPDGTAVATGASGNAVTMGTSDILTITLSDSVKIGKTILVSIAGSTLTTVASVSDGVNTISFTPTATNTLTQIPFTMGKSTNVITVTQTSAVGSVRFDGIRYSQYIAAYNCAETCTPVLYSLGNRVFLDTNNSGNLDGAETGIDGVKLQLLNADGSVYDSDPNTAGIQADTVTTGNGGYYRFDDLTAGSYMVEVLASNFTSTLLNYNSSTGNSQEVNPNADVDNNDNGLDTPVSGAVRSGIINLSGAEPTSEPIPASYPIGSTTGTAAADTLGNLTVDFGFYPAPTCAIANDAPIVTNSTCAGPVTNANGSIVISNITGADKFAFNTSGGTGLTYSTATTIAGSTISLTGLTNGSSATTYTIRIFNGNDTCFKDIQVVLAATTCSCPTKLCIPVSVTRN